MTRVLQVVYQMNHGGVENWLMHVLRAFDRSRFQMDFITFSDASGAFDDEIRSLGGQVFRCRPPKDPLRHRKDIDRILQDKGPYKVVHSHSPLWDGVVIKAAFAHQVPIRIVHSHNDQTLNLPKSKLKKIYFSWMRRVGLTYLTHGLACSEFAATSYFGPSWHTDSRYQTLTLGEDFSAYHERVNTSELRKSLDLPSDAVVIGHVGSFRSSQKNHPFLIKIGAELAKRKSNVHFLLVGDGVRRGEIQELTRQLGIESRVTFAGIRNDIPQLLLGAMDVFLFPSLYEGLGLALVEAQAAGLPCVCSDVIPVEAMVVPGLVQSVPLAKSPGEWADLIISHLDTTAGYDRRNALRQIEDSKFNLHNCVSKLEKIYEA